MTQDVNCIMLDMPSQIKGYTISNPDNSFTVVLNSKLTHEQRLISYRHEINHIQHRDFEFSNADDIEIRSHNIF